MDDELLCGPFWAVALAEEVTDTKPMGVTIGDRTVVLWRDKQGVAHALEDRCPHRRAPLSLGCVRDDGNLQCGYHGWSFDGGGKVIEIPQMREQKRFPPLYRAEAFKAFERSGFVFVSMAGKEPQRAASGFPEDMQDHGVAYSPIDHGRVIELLLDGPHLLIDISGIRMTEYPLADPDWHDGLVIYERGCRKRGGILPDRFRSELPFAMRLAIDPVTGLTSLGLRDAANRIVMEAAIAPVPARRGTTAIRWRSRALGRIGPLGRLPQLTITGSPDGRQVECLLKDASTVLDEPRHDASTSFAAGDAA